MQQLRIMRPVYYTDGKLLKTYYNIGQFEK